MGEIVGAALVSHVPPLVLPEEIRRELNNGDDTTLFQGLHDLRAEKLGPLEADTVVVIDTHWFTTIEHIVASHDRRSGSYTSEELPRGMAQMPYDLPGDPELAHAWAAQADGREDTWITPIETNAGSLRVSARPPSPTTFCCSANCSAERSRPLIAELSFSPAAASAIGSGR